MLRRRGGLPVRPNSAERSTGDSRPHHRNQPRGSACPATTRSVPQRGSSLKPDPGNVPLSPDCLKAPYLPEPEQWLLELNHQSPYSPTHPVPPRELRQAECRLEAALQVFV